MADGVISPSLGASFTENPIASLHNAIRMDEQRMMGVLQQMTADANQKRELDMREKLLKSEEARKDRELKLREDEAKIKAKLTTAEIEEVNERLEQLKIVTEQQRNIQAVEKAEIQSLEDRFSSLLIPAQQAANEGDAGMSLAMYRAAENIFQIHKDDSPIQIRAKQFARRNVRHLDDFLNGSPKFLSQKRVKHVDVFGGSEALTQKKYSIIELENLARYGSKDEADPAASYLMRGSDPTIIADAIGYYATYEESDGVNKNERKLVPLKKDSLAGREYAADLDKAEKSGMSVKLVREERLLLERLNNGRFNEMERLADRVDHYRAMGLPESAVRAAVTSEQQSIDAAHLRAIQKWKVQVGTSGWSFDSPEAKAAYSEMLKESMDENARVAESVWSLREQQDTLLVKKAQLTDELAKKKEAERIGEPAESLMRYKGTRRELLAKRSGFKDRPIYSNLQRHMSDIIRKMDEEIAKDNPDRSKEDLRRTKAIAELVKMRVRELKIKDAPETEELLGLGPRSGVQIAGEKYLQLNLWVQDNLKKRLWDSDEYTAEWQEDAVDITAQLVSLADEMSRDPKNDQLMIDFNEIIQKIDPDYGTDKELETLTQEIERLGRREKELENQWRSARQEVIPPLPNDEFFNARTVPQQPPL